MHQKIVLATALVIAIAHDIRTQTNARKERNADLEVHAHTIASAVIMGTTYENKLTASKKQIEYLVGMLNENNIAIDEFDLIALNFHNQ